MSGARPARRARRALPGAARRATPGARGALRGDRASPAHGRPRAARPLELGLVDVAVDEDGARARVTAAERTDLARSETFGAAERRLAAGVAALAGADARAA